MIADNSFSNLPRAGRTRATGPRASFREVKTIRAIDGSDMSAGTLAELRTLSAEVFELLYAQVSEPGEYETEASVCEAFAALVLRHWDLCCVSAFLRDPGGRLRECVMHPSPQTDAAAARRVSQLLAARVEREGREWQLWSDEPAREGADEHEREPRRALAEAGGAAGVALPIGARGQPAGALVAVAARPDHLRAALAGLRHLAAPVVVALGNARRAAALKGQRARIEHLVEELRRRSRELEEANRELQRVGRYRSLFLARMSHELRTPLTSMLGFAEILLEHETLTEAQRRYCEKIQASGLQLHTSVNQLVDLSRLEAGRTELFLHEFSVREMLRESCAAVARLARKQRVALDCVTAPECGTLVSDEGKLRQVLYNFLAYAITRSPAGATVGVRAQMESPARLAVTISDEGPPLSDPAHVFDPVEVDAPNERGTNMNELGLVVAHRLVALLKGTVAFDTNAPRGLTVRLELPARPTEKEGTSAEG